MIAYIFDCWFKQHALHEVEVLCHHGDHIDVPAFGKAFYGVFQFFICQDMHTVFMIFKIALQQLSVFYLIGS